MIRIIATVRVAARVGTRLRVGPRVNVMRWSGLVSGLLLALGAYPGLLGSSQARLMIKTPLRLADDSAKLDTGLRTTINPMPALPPVCVLPPEWCLPKS